MTADMADSPPAGDRPTPSAPHAGGQPSDWVLRWTRRLAPGARVLDVACGSGRHLRALAGRDLLLTGVDRDGAAVEPLRGLAEIVVADLEGGPWPLADRRFDAVIVTNYLWRPLMPRLLEALAPGGVLIYETFAEGQQAIGRPSRPEFLLRPAELLAIAAPLHVLAFEQGFLDDPPRCLQRIAAVSAPPAGTRHPLA